ncbi:Yos9p [Saccharomyces eubayanus]|uniref:Yos9p n=1 Tax=Saccharomyces eubayanus TaxID=1080349 RepID=UPI0006C3DF77|nr:YOS9-like protein [Saccharomyces eubayanus]KOH00910.1 YOS9-like protein [Saccharomyces eubayanus]
MQTKTIHSLSIIPALIQLVSSLLAPIADPIVSNKYLISYVNENQWNDRILQNQSAMDSGSIVNMGGNFECFIQDASSQFKDVLEKSSEYGNAEKKALLTDTLNQGVKTIFDKLNGQCIFYQAGFWIYEYCPGKEFVQFHAQINTQTGEFVNRDESLVFGLGKSKESLDEREFELLYDDVGYYISEIIGSGDRCDKTGAERMVEIQYVCGGSNSGPATIQWVRETKICVYEAQVAIPELCNLELLAKNEDQKNASPILCKTSRTNGGNSVDLITQNEPIFLGNGIYFLRPYNTHERVKLMVTDKVMSNWDMITDIYYQKFGNAINKMLGLELVSLPNGHILQPGDSCIWLAEIVDIEGQFQTILSLSIFNSQRAEMSFNKTLTFDGVNGNFISYKIRDPDEPVESSQLDNSDEENRVIENTQLEERLIGSSNELFTKLSKEITEVKELLNQIVGPQEMELILENMRNIQPNSDFELALMNGLKSSLVIGNDVDEAKQVKIGEDGSIKGTKDNTESSTQMEELNDVGQKKESMANGKTSIDREVSEEIDLPGKDVRNEAADILVEHDEL